MFEAARLHDEIAHTSALAGFLVGAALGLALVAAVASATLTCGLGVALIAGLLAGLGGMGLVAAGEGLGRMMSSPAGGIEHGSSNVLTNGLKAAYAEASVCLCEKHPNPPPLVAQGSAKVFINGMAAARKGDKLTCGAVIDSGSSNVFIGAESETYLDIQEEVPQWLRTTIDILMVVAGAAGSLAKMALMAGKFSLKTFSPCAMKYLAGFAAGEMAGRYLLGPVIDRAVGGLFGNPVDAVSGRKLLLDDNETDFSLPGLMPIAWGRFYASDVVHEGLLGRGWVLPWEQSLRVNGEELLLRDNQGRVLPLPMLAPGERVYLTDQQFFLVCSEGGHYLLQTLDNQFFYFGELPADGTPARLRRIENALGHFLHLVYDCQQRLSDISATGGIRLHLDYERADDRLTKVVRVVDSQAVETLVRYQYDAQGQLASVTDRNGQCTRRFAYENGLMVRHENALGLSCEYRWMDFLEAGPRVVEHWTSDGERYRFKYHISQRQTQIIDALGRNAQIEYNEQRRVVASQDFGGERYRIELDEAGNLTGLTLPDDNTLVMAYDEYSRLIEETDPLGRTTRYSYHLATNLVTAIKRADGSGEQWAYDRNGNLLQSIDTLGGVSCYKHHDNGLPHTRQDPLGNTTQLGWSELGLLEYYQDCSGQRTRYYYDQRLHLVAMTDALGNITRVSRRASGEVLRIEHADGSIDAYGYNALGQVVSHTSGDGHTTYLERTPRGLLKRRKDPRGEQVQYHYDAAQRLVGLVNENQATYRFRYDASDRLLEETGVDGLRRHYRYTPGGLLAELTEFAPGRVETLSRSQQFEHDAAGRLLCRITADARIDYRYDAADRVVAIERQASVAGRAAGIVDDTLTLTYDLAGRLLEEHGEHGTVGYRYDAQGNLVHLTLPDGRTLNHLYYGSGHLHQINLDGMLISDFERDALHRETLRSQGAMTSRFGYDSKGRKVWQAGVRLPHETLSRLREQGDHLLGLPEHPATLVHRRYHYSRGGEMERVGDCQRGVTEYRYDAASRLRSRRPQHSQLSSEDFNYDAAGNLCAMSARQFEGAPGNRLVAYGELHFSYDAWGNLTEKGHANGTYQRFVYDNENRLRQAQTWQGTRLQREAHYRYDCLGRRTAKKVTQGSEVRVTEFLWQGLRLLMERQPEHCSLYVYEEGSYAPLARVDTDVAPTERVPRRYYFHTDQIGTPLEMTDVDGQIVWRGYYKAWGALEAVAPNAVEQNLRFQGQYCDKETGLHYNTLRYYDPGVGRFTTQDPIGLLGGLNLYQYGQNPIRWIDPSGLAPKDPLSLPDGYRGRIDRFNTGAGSSFEIHVYAPNGKEVGVYGPHGFFSKHGLISTEVRVPTHVSQTLNGLAIIELRKAGLLPNLGMKNSRVLAREHTRKIKATGNSGC